MSSILQESDRLSEFSDEEDEVDQGQNQNWDDWQDSDEEGSFSSEDYLCLFCDTKFDSTQKLFEHCKLEHEFDFRGICKASMLDFYGSMKLINFVRSQVAQNKCWDHTLETYKKDGKLLWEDEMYLKPFKADDALLHCFVDDAEDEEDDLEDVSRDVVMRELKTNIGQSSSIVLDDSTIRKEENFADAASNGTAIESDNKHARITFPNAIAREIKNVNEDYFGSYGSFSIHREMLSDKIRTDAYRDAILLNPSLLKQSTVLDVGCGTGILSLFAAQAGASRIIAVEASTKMASIATQIAKDNGIIAENKECPQQFNVVQTMVEDLDKCIEIQPHSVDVLISEWMGYCLLYESMLTSVLYARDHWLKPDGAILPDTATIFIAGFGKGGTSLPFWENVYGFNMHCIGEEVVEDAAKNPIVDVVDSKDIVTESAALKFFDLTTMTEDDMDFTATSELKLKPDEASDACYCHGIVLWFDTGFTSRFCKEHPVNLSTSPYTQRTHWSQTIFTFKEPIAMATSPANCDNFDAAGVLGSESCPVAKVGLRISIARSLQRHRSIDISMETHGLGFDGRKQSWPVQIFKL